SAIPSEIKDPIVRVWNAYSGLLLHKLHGHTAGISAVIFSADGARLATASDDATARIWNMATPEAKPLILQGHIGRISRIAFSPDGTSLATAGVDATVRVWEASSGRLLYPLTGHTAPISGLTFSPDGMRLATASADATARIWKLASPQAESLSLKGH